MSVRGQSLSLGKNRILNRMSDTTQKLVERDWCSGDAKQLDCGTGKKCFVKDVIDPSFKLHYRGQMIKLIRKIIVAVCDPNYDCTGDTKRETKISRTK